MTELRGAALALSEIAYVAGELVAVREAGFTEAALAFPRSEAGLVALCAFNGIKVEQAPCGWRYWPNAGMKACWERVIEALWERAAAAIAIEAATAGETTKRYYVATAPSRAASTVDGQCERRLHKAVGS